MSEYLTVGRLELVYFPIAKKELRAKVDTGAMTSAISVVIVGKNEDEETPKISFHLSHRKRNPEIITLPMIDERFVKSSCGEKRFRPVVEMPIVIGESQWLIEVTLTNRSSMRYPMLIGRQALSTGRCIVDVSRAYIRGNPKVEEEGK